MNRALPLLASAVIYVVACGSSSTKKNPDAKGSGTGTDAGTGTNTPDAPAAGLTGLGQKCTQPSDCPATAPECITLKQGGTMYCTPHCLDNGTGTTNGANPAQFVGSGTGALTPLPDDTKCSAQYSGSAAQALCEVILSTTPMDNPLKANTKYTAVTWGCLIDCSTAACPTGTTCDATQKICYPN